MKHQIPITIPAPLLPGNTVELVGLSGCIHDSDYREQVMKAQRRLEAFGFRVFVNDTCYRRFGYLSGTDSERAKALNRAFENEKVQGIWCIKGGFGCTRILDDIDWAMVKRHPKAFIGFSDITALHLALNKKCNLATFHGPMPRFPIDKQSSIDSLLHAIGGKPDRQLINPDGLHFYSIRPGVAEGQLIGGNLSLVASLCGTEYLPDMQDKILFLEDIGEKTYAIDRMLHQLLLAGVFKQCKGVLLGTWTDCCQEYDETGFSLDEVFQMFFSRLNIPVLAGVHAGHVSDTLTLPLGRRYQINADLAIVTRIDE